MRRLLLLGLGSALLVALGIILGGARPAAADNGPHVSSAVGAGFDRIVGIDRCDSCHRANTAQKVFLLTTGRDGLCLTCHGSSASGASTDVVDGVGYEVDGKQSADRGTATGALRGGGFDYALIGSGAATKDTYLCGTTLRARNQNIPVLAAGQATTSSHRITGATGTALTNAAISSSSGPAVALECGSCHDPHGNGSYRILRPIPAEPPGISTQAVGVTIPDTTTKVYTTTNYWLTGDAGVPAVVNGVHVGTDVPDGFIGNIAQWCTMCHNERHADTKSKMGVGANCITCHVAHGSNASMSGANANGASGASTSGANASGANASTSGANASTSGANASTSGANASGAESSKAKGPVGLAAPCVSSRLLRVDNGAACLMCHNG